MSYRYEKMYVIRPQFFIPIITLLRNAAMGSLRYKQELAEYKLERAELAIALPALNAGEKENTPKAEPETMLPPERGSAASRLRQ